MRFRMQSFVFLIALAPVLLHAQTAEPSAAQDNKKFVGVWRGQFDNLPGAGRDLVENRFMVQYQFYF